MLESKFLLIKCPRCRKPQITFGKATLNVKCLKCNKLLVKTTGGKTKIKAEIKEVL